MADNHDEVPDWLVERLALGELPKPVADRVRAQLLSTGRAARLDALAEDTRVVLERHPPDRAAAEIRLRLAAQQRPVASLPLRLRLTMPVLAGGALALVALLLPSVGLDSGSTRDASPASQSISRPDEGDVVRLKGLEPRLAIYKKTSDGAAPLHDGSPVWPGDVIQVAYVASGYRYGVVVSVDGNRAVTLHLPESHGAAVALKPQGETALGHAFELDATSGRERFVFVASHQPFTTHTVIDALRAGETLPPAFVTTELSLEKSSP